MSNLVRYNTPSLLGRSIFDELFGDFQSLARKSTQGYPVADIFSNEDGSTTIEFALAGFCKEDLTIEKTQLNKSISELRISLSKPGSVSYYDSLSFIKHISGFGTGTFSIEVLAPRAIEDTNTFQITFKDFYFK